MARTVGVSAEELAAAGREDAAQQLRALEHERGLRGRITAIPGLGVIGPHPLTSMFVDNLIYDAARRHAELLLMLRIATGDVQPG
ncbi:MAG TPA: hypothetical protein DHU96_19365 [Actinobacteria bacterium]|nr:hypothetical protein [Actinomycetota bacterium]